MTTRSACVTGGTGYLGSRLVRHLVGEGWTVAVLGRRGSPRQLPPDLRDRVQAMEHDGTIAGLTAALKRTRPDCVFHLATLFLAQHRPDDVEALVASNILLGTQLLEAMAASGGGRMVNVGTSWQTTDGSAYRPANLYAATKQAFEDILRFYQDATPLRAVTLHLFDTYGPEDPRGKLVSALCQAARSGMRLELSPGEQRLDLMHADDVARALSFVGTALQEEAPWTAAPYRHFALRSGKTHSLREVVALIEGITGRPLNVEWGARPYRPREIMLPASPHPDLPGWAPQITLADGIKQLLTQETT
jgi:nucleoside-diphosphate-sugar epimerase